MTIFEIRDGFTSYEVDLAAARLPRLDPTFDFTLGAITIPPTSGADGDLMFTRVTYGDGSFSGEWIVFGPYQTRVAFPETPPDFGVDRPGPGDQGFILKMQLVESSAIPDFKTARQTPYAAMRSFPLARALGTRVRESHYR